MAERSIYDGSERQKTTYIANKTRNKKLTKSWSERYNLQYSFQRIHNEPNYDNYCDFWSVGKIFYLVLGCDIHTFRSEKMYNK